MSKTAKLWSAVVATAAFLIVGITFYVWSSGQSVRKITSLRSQLAQGDLSTTERNSLKTQLMRTVDEMDRDKLRTISASMREQRREMAAQRVRDFHAADESQKVVVLDEAIDQMVAESDFNSALSNANRGGNQQQRGDQAGRDRERNAGGQGNAAGDQRRGGDQRRRGGEKLSKEVQQQRIEYYEALTVRAKERGVRIDDGRRRRRERR